MEKTIKVGKNQEVKSLEEALKMVPKKGTIYLEPGVYQEHVNFDKEIKLIGIKDSIMNKSSSELPIIVLDSEKSCEITAPVSIEGVVFTHNNNLTFDELKSHVDDKNEQEIINVDDPWIGEYGDEDFVSCLLINNDAILKNIAVLYSFSVGIALVNSKGKIEDSVIAICVDSCIRCLQKTEAVILRTKIASGEVRYGIGVHDTSNPIFLDCEIYDNEDVGIFIAAQSGGLYKNCDIYNNGSHSDYEYGAIEIQGSSTPRFEGCKIHDNKMYDKNVYDEVVLYGVIVSETANPSFIDCKIYNNDGDGISVSDQASGLYKNCYIYGNKGNGLYLHDNSTPKFEGCKIHDNEEVIGVYILDESDPILINCEIYNHLAAGVSIDDQARGTYRNCDIYNNKLYEYGAIEIQGSSTPRFEGCKIHDNKIHDISDSEETDVYGIGVYCESNPIFIDCKIYNNDGVGISVSDQASGLYKNCYIYGNKDNGLYLHDNSTPKFEGCKIHDNKITDVEGHVGVFVLDESDPILINCEIYNHLTAGIMLDNQARGTYRNCNIHDNDSVEVSMAGGASPKFEACKIYARRKKSDFYSGIICMESSNPSFTCCEFCGHMGGGIMVLDQAVGTHKNCDIHDNKKNGVKIMNSAYPIFEDCNIYKNEWNGIYVEDDADVSLTNCDLYDNAAGDFVTSSANPIISLMKKFSDEEDD